MGYTTTEHYIKQCAGKVGHYSKWRADIARARSEIKFGTRMNTYRCPYCNRWHVGSAK